MLKESRANLLFVLALLVLIIPGFLILMNKKLHGTSEPNYMPEPVPSAAAYIQPPPIPPGVPRVEPPAVRAWITKLIQDNISPTAGAYRKPGDLPAVGESFRAQVVYVNESEGKTRVALIRWENPNDTTPFIIATAHDKPIPATLANWKTIDLPRDVRRSLQSVGFINPPQRISLADVSFDAAAIESVRLEGDTRIDQISLR